MTFPNANINDPRTHKCPKCGRRVSLHRCQNGGPNHDTFFLACFWRGHSRVWHFFEPGEIPTARALDTSSPVPPPAPPVPAQTACAWPVACSRHPNMACRFGLCRKHCLERGRHCGVHSVRPSTAPSAQTAPSKGFTKEFMAGLARVAAEGRAPLRQINAVALQEQQQAAALLASLASRTPLPPSPTLSQEERDRDYALRLALGDSPLPSPPTTSTCSRLPPPIRRVVLIYYSIDGERAVPTVVQDLAVWASTWPRIRLVDFEHLLPGQPQVEFYSVDFHTWMRIPISYTHTVVTDQPLLVRKIGVVGGDEDHNIRYLLRFLGLPPLPSSSPCPTLGKRRRALSPSPQRHQVHPVDTDMDTDDEVVVVSALTKILQRWPLFIVCTPAYIICAPAHVFRAAACKCAPNILHLNHLILPYPALNSTRHTRTTTYTSPACVICAAACKCTPNDLHLHFVLPYLNNACRPCTIVRPIR